MNLDDGKLISDIVESALKSGDFSKLRDLGPAVQRAVTTAIVGEPKSRPNYPPANNRPSGTGQSYPPPQGQRYTSPPPQGQRYTPPAPQRQPYTPPPPTQRQPYTPPPSQGQPYTPPASKGQPYTPSHQGQPIQPYNQGWGPLSKRNPLKISKSLPQIVLSSIGTFVFGILTLIFISPLIATSAEFSLAFAVRAIIAVAPTFVCAGFLVNGLSKNKLANRLISLASLFQQKSVYTFDELASLLGRTPKQIKKDLRKARAKGLLPQLRVDDEETCVMWGEAAYQQYLETKKAHQQRLSEAEERKRRLANPQTADIEHFRSEGQATIQKIREANAAIPGEEISVKLAALEETTDRIFVYVGRYPQKLPDTRKFMSYYLPTTLKLVEKYRQFDEMEFQPENIKQAKQDIESALDTINMAFANLLESLFDHETMDVVTDIDVLKKMLEQEGLTNNKDFKDDSLIG